MSTTNCYHCGTSCGPVIAIQEKFFCCDGCKLVYQLLDENGMCQYYDLTQMPGLTAKGSFTSEKYNYLDSPSIQDQLVQQLSNDQALVLFYLPQIHCVSCVWLLEHLNKINPGIIHSQTQFDKKEIKVVYNPALISLKELVQLLAFVGYEPMIHLGGNDLISRKKVNRKQLFKIGIAGFCFSNIMMLSFPEYLSVEASELGLLRPFFVYLNLFLSLPVLFYSASGFFISAYTGLRQKWLNIDAPIALAIIVTFSRSVYEIITQTGAGYLDSMSGIVFFMLIGRWFQDKSYDSFSFDRDYTSFFPLAATQLVNGKEENQPLASIQKGARLLIRSDEMIPADATLLSEGALIDYSFVTGEHAPVEIPLGQRVYAGGIQKGRAIEVQVVKPVGQSYITELWNSPALQNEKNKMQSFVHPWSQYFTMVLLLIALGSGMYWWWVDPSKILPAITSVLIVACPCSLLLTVTFTYGNVLRWLGRSKLYCKNASVVESLEEIDTIVFDKTGTLTNHQDTHIEFMGEELSMEDQIAIKSITRESLHPLSQLIANFYTGIDQFTKVESIQNHLGKGTRAIVGGKEYLIGSIKFLALQGVQLSSDIKGSSVALSIEGKFKGVFKINHIYRDGLAKLFQDLKSKKYHLYLLSGDKSTEQMQLAQMLGEDIPMNFEQQPDDKLAFIQKLQSEGRKVMMVGDGLNDAGALKKANVGIAVTDQSHLFTPASDAIIEGAKIPQLAQFLDYAKKGKLVIILIFILSILYNIIGMYFATRAALSPMIAAILMPISSISIVSLSALFTYLFAKGLFSKN
jgi:Cu+-exporting ATPase